MKKRILSIFCVLALCLTLLPVTALAASPEGVWTDYAASGFAGGTGTESDPYQIATAEQLAKLSNDVSGGTSYQGKYFILTENIDLSAHRWVPIGLYKWLSSGTTVNNSFQGFLDGNNKTISGMYVDERTDKYCGGLFGRIAIVQNGSPVGAKDLTITGATVYVDETGLMECSGAILAGKVLGSDTQSVVFENITVSGSVHVTRTNGYNNIGGMLGYASWVKATNCHAKGVTISGASNCGGFVGNDSGSVYENCTASGKLDGAWALGGFVGYSASATSQDPAGASTYTKCAADVDVSGNDWRIGGFVGFAEYGQFNNCVAYGDVTSIVTEWEPKVGGFAGEDSSNVNITACHAVGVVTGASSDYQAGGFVGNFSGGIFTDCSFDSEKNPDLNAVGEGTIASGVTGEEGSAVLANICVDYYGGHNYSDEWAVETAATCTEAGSKYHPCERCGAKEGITEIPATGHEYGEPVWSWREDGKSCTATFICENDETHQETPEVTITSEVKTPATSTQNGVTEYTATTTFEGMTYTDTKEVADIPATGLDYVGVYTYAITVPSDVDGGTVMASLTRASSGTTVTLTVTPDEGYELASLVVTDASGNRQVLTAKGEGVFTFTMPGSNATVAAVFVPIEFPFVDVKPGDWFYEYVVYVYSNGLMDGTSATTFEPNGTMTRAMVWAILARVDGETVTGANWIETARSWAMANGVSDGEDANGYVTREQLATMLWRYAGEPASSYSLSAFTDAASVSDYAETAMAWAVEHGIITGMTDTTIVPQGTATRAQCAAMLMRFIESVA